MKVNLKEHPEIKGLFISKSGEFFYRLPMFVGYGGYTCVHLGAKQFRRSNLVLEIYKGPRPKKHVARHLNGDPSNDNPKNLEWGTQKENCQDTILHGRTARGIKNIHAKLTKTAVTEIRKRRKNGERLKDIAADFGISSPTICDLMKGRTWGWYK